MQVTALTGIARVFCCVLFFVFSYACSGEPPIPPPLVVEQNVTTPSSDKIVAQLEETQPVDDYSTQAGYIYERRERRDPFLPLIFPSEKVKKVDASKVGTLENYDIAEFSLSAIAKKGPRYYALLVTPDQRSFTVDKGTRIGLNRGKVQEIARDKVVLVEYSKDYRGELKPREIILEFIKGEKK